MVNLTEMALRERSVGRLRLRAASEAQARRGALRIEDALRCASLPGQGAGLLLVRRLALGRVDADAPSQTVALAIERCLGGLALRWQHGAAADDGQAEAVWFADRVQALSSLALRLAEGRPVRAWYWARLLPPAAPRGAAPPGVAAVLLALSLEPAAKVALPAVVAELLQRIPWRALDAMVTPAVGAALLRQAGIAPGPTGWIDSLLAQAEPLPGWQADAGGATRAAGAAPTAAAPPVARRVPGEAARQGVDAALTDAPVPTDETRGAVEAAPADEAPPPSPGLLVDPSLPTIAGGCLFLLPVLERLGFAEANGAEMSARVLRSALQRLQVPADDPMQCLFAPRRSEPPDDPAEASAVAWLTACRRALRRHFRIGLASLVLRPARLAATRSHIDLHFALAATDLRVRRHGLDLDPGWLPWFGRVVAFHFDRR